jgi:lipoprotein-releasing system permease protein
MNWPYELQVGWRYTRAGRNGRRNGFISFISGVSILGIALGVAALIIVLSVMNGFRKEVQDRMLSVIAHVEVMSADGNALPDWRDTLAKVRAVPGAGAEVVGAAPFVSAQALLARGDDMRGVIVRGISLPEEASVTEIAAKLKDTVLARLVPGQWGIVLGIELARSLGVHEGDKVTLVLPGGQLTPAGVVPRLRQMTVVGTFEAGHYEYDSTLALVALEDAGKLFRTEGPTGVQLRLKDVNDAREVGGVLQSGLGAPYVVPGPTRTGSTRCSSRSA